MLDNVTLVLSDLVRSIIHKKITLACSDQIKTASVFWATMEKERSSRLVIQVYLTEISLNKLRIRDS